MGKGGVLSVWGIAGVKLPRLRGSSQALGRIRCPGSEGLGLRESGETKDKHRGAVGKRGCGEEVEVAVEDGGELADENVAKKLDGLIGKSSSPPHGWHIRSSSTVPIAGAAFSRDTRCI